MATQVQIRRGTEAQSAAFVGAEGEVTYTSDLKRLVAHDGALLGGFPAAHLHLAQTFAQTQTFASVENFFGSTANPNNRIAFINPPLAGTSTFDFNTNGSPDLNFLRKYATTPFQVELASSGGIDFVTDSNNNEGSANIRFLTNGIRDSGTQTLLATFADNGSVLLTGTVFVGNTTPNSGLFIGSGYTATGSLIVPLIAASGNWNTTGNIKGIQLDITDVNSGPLSKLLSLEVNTVTQFSVSKTGDVEMTGSLGTLSGLTLAASALLKWNTRSVISSPANGVLRLTNNAETDFTRLQFGGTTSAFPAIGRNGTQLEILGADGAGPSGLYIYRTKTSATNFERLNIIWSGGNAQIFTEAGSGGGLGRTLEFGTDGLIRLTIADTGTIDWGSGISVLDTDGTLAIDPAGSNVFRADATSAIVSIGGGSIAIFDVVSNGIGFFGSGPTVQQDVNLLTNNVTPGGVADQIDNFDTDAGEASSGLDTVDISTVPDKQTVQEVFGFIRNDLYQLGQKVNEIVQLLEAYGLVTP